MGQVFSWDAIYEGRIPKPKSFRHAAEVIRERFVHEPSIVCALLFGSVIRGDSNIRSDLDCAVIYETSKQAAAMEAMHEVGVMAHKLHVPINFTPCDTMLAGTRFHHLGVSFVTHLQAAIDAGGLIKGNLIDYLAPTISARQEIESYIKMKMYSLQAGFAQSASFSEEELVRFLRKALEASTHVARKVLIYEGALRGDSKREVQARYRKSVSAHLADQFDHLLRVDAQYSVELKSQMESPDVIRYAAALVEILSEVPNVLEFVRSNILRLDAARQ